MNAALKRKIETGEGFDVAVLNPPVGAREMIRFFTAPAAAEVLRSRGVEPFVE